MSILDNIISNRKIEVEWQEKTHNGFTHDMLPFLGSHPKGKLKHGRKIHVALKGQDKTMCGLKYYSSWPLSTISSYGEEWLCKKCKVKSINFAKIYE